MYPNSRVGKFKVTAYEYLFLGDNRSHSFDSRSWKEPFIPVKNIKGKAEIILFNDITYIIKANEVLKKHFILFENAKDIIFYLKSDGSIIDANKTAIEKYGYTHAELLNMKLQQLWKAWRR